jgi:Pyruvate/2-oxoacid:ferredoxin oxidoreductase delta subunit
MTAKIKLSRKIVKIDEEKCNGCGACVPACAEGALQIIDGKARLVCDKYCDGLGACLGECPQEAITIEEREAEEFNEEEAKHHLHEEEYVKGHVREELPCGCPGATVTQFVRHEAAEAAPEEELPCGCSSATVTQFAKHGTVEAAQKEAVYQSSMLGHWPIQLTLVPPGAPFLQGADLVLAADCVPFAYAGFHHDFLKDHALLVACPKLDDFEAHLNKLTDILRRSQVKSLTVVHMEVPCCSGLTHIAKQAMRLSSKGIPLEEVIIGIKGDRRA